MSNFRVVEHVARAQNVRERPGAVKFGHEQELRLAVKQYIPHDNPCPAKGDVTLIGAHANGFPKELYEPLWDEIYTRLRARNRRIRSIWIADVVQQGQSGVLNEFILGDDPSWFDHGRDLLFLLNQFQDQIPGPLIGVGHSMGGMQLAHLSLMHPSLFEGLILMDPVIQRDNPSRKYALPSTYRRDLWPSRDEARAKFQSSSFYQGWDPRVLDKWVEYGLRDLPTKLYPISEDIMHGKSAVTLTTPKAQELFTFLRPSYIDERSGQPRGVPEEEMHRDDIDDFPFYRPEPPQIFRRLPELKPAVLYLFGSDSDLSSSKARREKLVMTGTGVGGSGGVSRGRVQEVVLPCGHLVPMERVQESAHASADFIDSTLSSSEPRIGKFQKAWGRVPHDERTAIDKQWESHIGVLPKKPRL
ncbi:peroxisomal membrane protein LPX1 [Aspergillus udagawae]|uniref:Peroxisomal membrane protein LPX1 n=1 Tax=Aspergillus udagawae TaxID=91492 RepID=A0A8H3S693_9EURO|nr:peroxisomal membrane protein LPX1 [Aspergillus udagawae]